MKYVTLGISLLLVAFPLQAQDKGLDSPDMEQTMTTDEFSDVIKTVWDSMKKITDPFENEKKSKGEFETSSEFETRVQKQKQECIQKIESYASEKKLTDRTFAVLMKASLEKYDADAQTYSITTPSQILIPSRQETMTINCPQNKFVSITETDKEGYKFAYIVLNTKPNYTWHVGVEIAQKAKTEENSIYFKVWFRIDISRPMMNDVAQMTILPFKIALINQDNNTSYWSEDIIR